MPYRLYITSGVLTWGVFTSSVQRGSNTFIEHSRYLKQLNLPLEIFCCENCVDIYSDTSHLLLPLSAN